MMKPQRPQFLVTAGNTREAIDDVRDWGNVFTGNTGFAIARALCAVGDIELLTSNEQHLQRIAQEGPSEMKGYGFRSHAELRRLLEARFAPSGDMPDGVLMTAAIADYRPVCTYEVVERRDIGGGAESWTVRSVQAGKVKSAYGEIAVRGERTEKLVDLFRREWGFEGLLIKFKLEVGETPSRLIEIARASRVASRADYVVANTLAMVSSRQGGFGAGAFLVGETEEEWVDRERLAERLALLVRQWWDFQPALVSAKAFSCD